MQLWDCNRITWSAGPAFYAAAATAGLSGTGIAAASAGTAATTAVIHRSSCSSPALLTHWSNRRAVGTDILILVAAEEDEGGGTSGDSQDIPRTHGKYTLLSHPQSSPIHTLSYQRAVRGGGEEGIVLWYQ